MSVSTKTQAARHQFGTVVHHRTERGDERLEQFIVGMAPFRLGAEIVDLNIRGGKPDLNLEPAQITEAGEFFAQSFLKPLFVGGWERFAIRLSDGCNVIE